MAAKVTCSTCGQENGAERARCASCGALLGRSPEKVAVERPDRAGARAAALEQRTGTTVPQPTVPSGPRPRAPMAHRRRAADSPYRLLSVILLIAIILVGAFLMSRLTTSADGSRLAPSPSRGSVTRLLGG